MAQVDLTDGEWQAVLGLLSAAPWRDANALMMKIGEQLRQAQQHRPPAAMQAGNAAYNESKN